MARTEHPPRFSEQSIALDKDSEIIDPNIFTGPQHVINAAATGRLTLPEAEELFETMWTANVPPTADDGRKLDVNGRPLQ